MDSNYTGHDVSTEESCDVVHTVGYIATVAGLLGLLYFGYKKRNSIPWDKINHVKEKTSYLFDPLVKGAKETKSRVHNSASATKEELETNFNDAFDTIHFHISKLSDDVQESYRTELEQLKTKLKNITNNSNNL